MHPDLSPHLHTEECNILINKLKTCHSENKFRKFIGICNDIDRQVLDCLRKERNDRRKINLEKSRVKQQAVQEKIKQEKLEQNI